MISLLCLCDITMFRFIPWTKSEFYTVSEGFPSMTLMNVCLVIKTVETFISVICDISYLALYANSDGVPSEQEQQTQALFVLNIIFGVGTIVMDLLVLCVRRGVLADLKETGPEEEDKKEKSTMELADVYKGKDEEEGMDGGIERVANPMHLSLIHI